MDAQCVTIAHPMSKSSNYRIRVKPELHQQFLDACRANDCPAAQVIREFMKIHVAKHQNSLQTGLFAAGQSASYNRREK